MVDHRIGTREEWLAARLALLVEEKEWQEEEGLAKVSR